MISGRGATPSNMMLNEVGRAHVAHAVPIVFQPAEVYKVWDAVSHYCRGALLAGINVSLFRKTISFSCSRRRTFKKVPASFHRDAQTFDVRVPLFGVSPSYATTYSLDSPIVEDRSFTYTTMPLKSIADAAKVPTTVVAAVLHDIMRFIGEALYRGQLLELEFPGLAVVRAKRDRVMTTFNNGFIAELLAIDTRKWPAAFSREARELLLPGPKPAGQQQQQQQQRPSSARPSSARSAASNSGSKATAAMKHAAPFVNAPAPTGRTFDEMNEILVNEQNRKSRSASARRPGSAARTAAGPSPAAGEENGAEAEGGAANLAVVYDESVPAKTLPQSPAGRNENVYDMVMPHPAAAAGQDGMEMTTAGGSAPPQANSRAPPVPQPRPEPMAQPPVRNAAAAGANAGAGMSTAECHKEQQMHHRPATGGYQRAPRHLHTNTHVNIFGFLGEEENESAPVSRKRRAVNNPALGTA